MATAKKTSAKTSAKSGGSKKAAVTTKSKTLAVRSPRTAKFLRITIDIEKAFKRAGCPGCRSGIDRIVFEDQVLGSTK